MNTHSRLFGLKPSNIPGSNQLSTKKDGVAQSHKPPRPNYKQIHALPLPIKTSPLPPLIPHNPFSVLHIALVYFFQLLAHSPSHPQALYQGYLSAETRSIHVTDEQTVRVLWERGFFGKGSLSRSEPSWLDRERRRRGVDANETSEDVTKRRRGERKEFKKDRARKEREAIEEKLRAEGKLPARRMVFAKLDEGYDINLESYCKNASPNDSLPSVLEPYPEELVNISRHSPLRLDQANLVILSQPFKESLSLDKLSDVPANDDIVNQEHLQLAPEEAFFLVYGLGVLQISALNTLTNIPTSSLFSLFRQNSYFPPKSPSDLHPDDPFILSYVVYHHFRSLGWVVRSGIKFAVDYLLYNRGPVFAHAEFAVVVLPAYSHPYWHATAERAKAAQKKECKSWWWLHCINRVQSQVRKSLLLVYVEVPSPMDFSAATFSLENPTTNDGGLDIDITRLLKKYRVRELSLRRWTPNRSRD